MMILEKKHNSGHQKQKSRFVRFSHIFFILSYFQVFNGGKRGRREGS